MKYSRSRTGCLGCRVKRVKCDEGRPVCKRCITAKRECVYPTLEELPKSTVKQLTAKKRKSGAGEAKEDPLAAAALGHGYHPYSRADEQQLQLEHEHFQQRQRY